jgi:choline dehydrogenase-like flavoprotein
MPLISCDSARSSFASTRATCGVLVNATATSVEPLAPRGGAFELCIATIDGVRSRVRARAVVLAASGIENPRPLLVSNRGCANGLGNDHDVVGRYLIDHPSARLGRFDARACRAIVRRFGFYGVEHANRMHKYMHGVTLSREEQEREGLSHCAAYVMDFLQRLDFADLVAGCDAVVHLAAELGDQ